MAGASRITTPIPTEFVAEKMAASVFTLYHGEAGGTQRLHKQHQCSGDAFVLFHSFYFCFDSFPLYFLLVELVGTMQPLS